MVVYRVVGRTKRRKYVRWEMSQKMADRAKEAFESDDMEVDVFKHIVPNKLGELLEWLNTYAV